MPVLLTIITRDDIADYVSGRLSRQQEEEVARLIEKAVHSGVRSLSADEKAVLDRFSTRH